MNSIDFTIIATLCFGLKRVKFRFGLQKTMR